MVDIPDRFAHRIIFRLSRASNLLNAISAAQLRLASEITLMQWRIMMLLDGATGRPISVRAATAGWDKSLVSRNIRKMADAGLIRLVPSAEDGRQTLVYPTEAGTALYRQILPTIEEWHMAIDEVLDTQGRETMFAILEKPEAYATGSPGNVRSVPALARSATPISRADQTSLPGFMMPSGSTAALRRRISA